MATSGSAEMWTVFIKCNERGIKPVACELPKDSTVADVKQMWADEVHVDVDTIVLKTMDKQVLRNDQTLMDIGEFFEGTVNLIAERNTSVTFDIYKVDLRPERVPVSLTSTPEELERVIREAFNLPVVRYFRLRTQQQPLESGRSLLDQGVDADTLLSVELGFELSVKDAWSNTEENYAMFSSDACEEVLSDDRTRPQRLLCGRKSVDTTADLLDALRPFGAEQRPGVSLRLESMRDLTLATEGRLSAHSVWPTTRPRDLLPSRDALRPRPAVMFAGDLLPLCRELCEADLPEGALLHTSPVAVSVRLSVGRKGMRKHVLVRVPALGAVRDVREAVREEEAQLFDVCLGGQRLAGDLRVSEAGLGTGAAVEAAPRGLDLSVQLCGCPAVEWRSCRRELRLSGVMREMEGLCDVRYEDLVRKTLCCVGCGRTLTWATEEAQPIPVACCEVRSLRLREKKTADFGAQSFCRSRTGVAPHRSVGTSLETVGRGIQAVAFWHQVGCQTDSTVRGQTDRQTSHFTQQHSSTLIPRPFLIRDYTFGGRFVPCDLLLPDLATVRDVRVAVASQIGMVPDDVILQRSTAKRRGEYEIALVCDAEGRHVEPLAAREYGDGDGRIWTRETFSNLHSSYLRDENERFVFVPGRRNSIAVHLRR